jgi:hypothetical protein
MIIENMEMIFSFVGEFSRLELLRGLHLLKGTLDLLVTFGDLQVNFDVIGKAVGEDESKSRLG